MRKAVTTSPGVMIVEHAERPECGPGQARIAVEAVGLCGSDYHLFSGAHPYARFPQTQGHEFAGVIEQLGPGYHGRLRLGERVAVEPLVPCGDCFACRRGRYNCCASLKVMGAHVPGALAEAVVVPVSSLYPVGSLDPVIAAIVEPTSVGLQAVRRGTIAAGDQVVVLGAGPIGLTATLAAADAGASVLVADRVAARLARARTLGAQAIVDTAGQDLGAAVAEWTHSDGAAVVIEATGVPALIRDAFDLVAHSGVIVIVGISDADVRLPVIEFTRKELSVYGSRNNAGIFADAVELVQRHAGLMAALITHRFPLTEVAEAISFAQAHPEIAEKVIITMAGAA